MPVASSAERALDVPVGTRAAMVLLGFIPIAHVLLTLAPVIAVAAGWSPMRVMWLAPACLYLVPPVIVRLITLRRALAPGRIELASADFLRWWATTQCQMVFARMPWF